MSEKVSTSLPSQERAPHPSAEQVRLELDQILSNSSFVQSERMVRLLRYIVEETLADRSQLLKEYTLAIEVFDRDESFDPQTSSLVRVEAGRLRTKLHEYYHSDGSNNAIIIDLPRGGYVPTFSLKIDQVTMPVQIEPASPATAFAGYFSNSKLKVLAAALLSVVVAGTIYVSWRLNGSTESIPMSQLASVAVLPLRNLTGDPEQDYFSDGMTDAIINRLAQSRKIRVPSLLSVMVFKNTSLPILEIGQKLNVDHLIEGSVVRSNDRVRITARLIDIKSGDHKWLQTFEQPMSDIIAMQDEVARRIRASLIGDLISDTDKTRLTPTDVLPAAYEAYLRGRFFRNKITADGFTKAIGYYQRAISIAPEFAPAHADLAACYCQLGGHGFELVKPTEGMPLAKRAAEEALRLDDTLGGPYAFLGIIRLKYDWDWAGSERAFKRSIELTPNLYLARLFYSLFLEAMGRHEEAIEQAEFARTINPLSLEVQVNLGWQYLQAGQLEQSRNHFVSALELEPKFWGGHWGLGHLYRRQGLTDKSIESFNRSVESGGGHVLPLTGLGHAYAVAGRRDDALKILQTLREVGETTYVSAFNLATIHAGLGEDDKALVELERAYGDRSRSLAWLNVMPEYDQLRNSPRFVELVRKVGLPRQN